ncbi:hypothetical protein N8K70_07095 [Microbacterium betulae]|uniref:Uncharacterized protein n=1 Tax=Microbacterium betulae TaxID=2981139 RepID=A0AA97FKD2_9MICO|nr:hypothetical protein [Microbacterium sp. AB]WOF24424.1 hypothetical protein N8K70_07095 [Microbacterium sp. AB]
MTADDVVAVGAFLRLVDLTTSGLVEPSVRLWLRRDGDGPSAR